MKRGIVAAFLACGLSAAFLPQARAEVRIIDKDFNLEMSNGTAKLIIARQQGGRVTHYSVGEGGNFFAGGFQMDIGPELEYPPRHPALWSEPYEAVANLTGPGSVHLTSKKDDATGMQMIKEVALDPTGAGVTVRSTMKNVGEKDVAYCLWDRTMTTAQYGFFELNPKSRFPAKWSIRLGENRSYSYDGKSPSSPRVKIVDNLLVTVPGKKMEKVGADSMAGWIAGLNDENYLYVKRFPVFPDGDYADGGNSVEFWVNPEGTRTEIEPLSPKVTLKPGESYTFTERWDLRRVEEKISGAEDIPKLMGHVNAMAQP